MVKKQKQKGGEPLYPVARPGNRIKTWDALRGVAIVLMASTHFFYYDARRFYAYKFSALFANLNGIPDFLAGVINLHASYLAPFLFLFIVGIISNIKFTKQKSPDIRQAVRRLIKLYFSTCVIKLIFFYKSDNLLEALIHFDRVVLDLGGILMTIAAVYLMNEFVLLYVLDYYRKSIGFKSCVMAAGSAAIIAFNVFLRPVYSNFHLLPWYLTILLGFYMGLLGDFFVSLHDPERPAGLRNILFFAVIPLLCCFMGYAALSPAFGAIKRMNFIYFAYCLFITYLIMSVLTVMERTRLLVPVNAMLEILGRYSLTLYIVHFFMGYSMEKFVLSPFVPQKFWFLNSIAVLAGCVLMALFFEFVNRRPAAKK